MPQTVKLVAAGVGLAAFACKAEHAQALRTVPITVGAEPRNTGHPIKKLSSQYRPQRRRWLASVF
jgi:hypothetical protein